jgi:hypothetical protein
MNEDTKAKVLGIGTPLAIVGTALLAGHPVTKAPITPADQLKVGAAGALGEIPPGSDHITLYGNKGERLAVISLRDGTVTTPGDPQLAANAFWKAVHESFPKNCKGGT